MSDDRHQWSSYGDGEMRWIGPPEDDPVMIRMRNRRAVLCGRVPPPRKAEEPEKVYLCKCGKALDPLEKGMLCWGCR